MTAKRLVAIALLPAGLMAHHSLTNYDTSKAFRIKGVIVQFNEINPHSILYVEETRADGQKQRWAIEGPSILQLKRIGFDESKLKAGGVVEVCGYLPKEPVMWQVATSDTSKVSLSGRLMNAEVMVMPDGKQQSWGDYGFHRCFDAGFTDQHNQR